jgi:hypothetical protein
VRTTRAATTEVRLPLLWFARTRYRPGGLPSDPALREAWDLGRAQRQGGPSCPTPEARRRIERFSAREREAYWGGLRTGAGDPLAPIKFHIEVALLAIEAALQDVSDKLPAAVCAVPVSLSIGKLRTALERQRAGELGLTRDTAPQAKIPWDLAVVGLGRSAYLRVRGMKAERPRWEFVFAQSVIREIERRRAWRYALRSGGW